MNVDKYNNRGVTANLPNSLTWHKHWVAKLSSGGVTEARTELDIYGVLPVLNNVVDLTQTPGGHPKAKLVPIIISLWHQDDVAMISNQHSAVVHVDVTLRSGEGAATSTAQGEPINTAFIKMSNVNRAPRVVKDRNEDGDGEKMVLLFLILIVVAIFVTLATVMCGIPAFIYYCCCRKPKADQQELSQLASAQPQVNGYQPLSY